MSLSFPFHRYVQTITILSVFCFFALVPHSVIAADSNPSFVRALYFGVQGGDVKQLQLFLASQNFFPKDSVTGYYGHVTQTAVVRFQRREHLEAVGKVGPKTRERLNQLVTKQWPQEGQGTQDTTTSLVDAVLSDSLTESGKTTRPTSSFASTTPTIYAIISVRNARKDTEVGYVRLLGTTYIDSATTHPSADNVSLTHFQWSLKDGKNRTPGDYTLILFINGARSQIIHYTIN